VTRYAVIREGGPSWDASRALREQDAWAEHAAFMDGLFDEGFIVLGGPLEDGPKTLLIVEAGSEQEIVDRLADDPWTPMGVLRIASIERWQLFLGNY
jgi:uncharacterized protein YciI